MTKIWENLREDLGLFHIDVSGIRDTTMNEIHSTFSMPELLIFLLC